MRVIDADKLIKRAIERYKQMMGTDIGHGMGIIASMITDSPTIDAVPVVRCEDCTMCRYEECSGLYHCDSYNGLHREVLPYEYCSYGERREGADDD